MIELVGEVGALALFRILAPYVLWRRRHLLLQRRQRVEEIRAGIDSTPEEQWQAQTFYRQPWFAILGANTNVRKELDPPRVFSVCADGDDYADRARCRDAAATLARKWGVE